LLNPDFRDILSVFNDLDVEYMVVGAYALAAHGLVRATGDIDLWIECSEKNSERVIKALAIFGAPLSELTHEDLKTPGLIFQIGVAPNRIDILTSIDGVEFHEARSSCKKIEIENLEIPIISRTHLLQNKKASGRPKDKADIAWLENS